MPIQAPQWTEFLSCPVCCHEFAAQLRPPISLGCGHTICRTCLGTLHRKQCPFDQTTITTDLDNLPINYALLQLVSNAPQLISESDVTSPSVQCLKADDLQCYNVAKKCIEELALYLKPISSGGSASNLLSRPMQRKLVTLVNCQLIEDEGRSRALRAARSLGERTVTELILQHQNPQQLSANLWAAVRARGCQFLGPAMQEEVLKLILLALEDGSALSRKVLVMFVVQRLEPQFPQASKTSIGHVVQLLYRASCFKVSKRDGDSSLMQLKEEFRTYEALRREHDAQIVQIATEAGLRIAPDQWSALLYGDTAHKSHMQSIIDKLQTPQSFAQSVQELVLALQRTGDPANLSGLRAHLKSLAAIDPTAEGTVPTWQEVAGALEAVRQVVVGLVEFVQHYGNRKLQETTHSNHNTKYKISMCRDLTQRGTCPRGTNCTFAHSEEELEKYRAKTRKINTKTPTTSIKEMEYMGDGMSHVPHPYMTPDDVSPMRFGGSKAQTGNLIGQPPFVDKMNNVMHHPGVISSPIPNAMPPNVISTPMTMARMPYDHHHFGSMSCPPPMPPPPQPHQGPGMNRGFMNRPVSAQSLPHGNYSQISPSNPPPPPPPQVYTNQPPPPPPQPPYSGAEMYPGLPHGAPPPHSPQQLQFSPHDAFVGKGDRLEVMRGGMFWEQQPGAPYAPKSHPQTPPHRVLGPPNAPVPPVLKMSPNSVYLSGQQNYVNNNYPPGAMMNRNTMAIERRQEMMKEYQQPPNSVNVTKSPHHHHPAVTSHMPTNGTGLYAHHALKDDMYWNSNANPGYHMDGAGGRDPFVRSDSLLTDDEYVPFEAQPSSKFGPISRMSTKSHNTPSASSQLFSDIAGGLPRTPFSGPTGNSLSTQWINSGSYAGHLDGVKDKEMELNHIEKHLAECRLQTNDLATFDLSMGIKPKTSPAATSVPATTSSLLWSTNNGQDKVKTLWEVSKEEIPTEEDELGVANGILEMEKRLKSDLEDDEMLWSHPGEASSPH
ncbi:roquin-1 [Phlebotomus argentipes]|uniref:roquin-1 n=1 Tax=Phlebotomus argentipes TaxID=94469 RepID=UPI002892B7C1|nr:roquin-1 [Phlebotomus argentipes]